MKSVGKLWLWLVGAMIFFGALGFVANGMGLISYKFFGPKWEDARRDVYENTNSFVKGKLADTNKHMLEWKRSTDPVERNALKYTISQNLIDFDEDKYCKSVELKAFIKKMKYGTPEPVPIE
jgi:hypothetical protein